MPANGFEFNEHWDLPGERVEDVYAVLADGRLLPDWWKGVYLEAVPLSEEKEPRVGAQLMARARGALPYHLRFKLEAVELVPNRKIVVRTEGDFIGLWTAVLRQETGGVHVDLNWKVIVERPILKLLSPLLRPAFAWNHRWTTPRGEQGLKAYLSEKRKLSTAH